MTLLRTEMMRNLLNVSLMNLFILYLISLSFVASFMKLFTDLLQHRFSFPIPLQFFLFYEHFYVVITLSCAIKIEGLGFLIICMRRFNVLLQMLSTGMACTSIIKLTQILLTETLIEKYQVITKIVPLGVINRMFG